MSAPNGLGSIAVPSKPLSPDEYKNYALQDPGFLGLQSALTGNEDAFQAQARGGINKGVISLGLSPSDASLAPWLDSGTAAAASANPLSQAAGLATQHKANVRGIQNNLAARGGYDSGELTYGLGNEDTRDTAARSDAMGKFLDYANGLFSQLGTMKATDASQLGSELGNAAMRQLALHPGSTTSATWDDNRGAYVDADGNLYDQNGNHIGTGDAPPTNFGTQNANGPIGPDYVHTLGLTPQFQPINQASLGYVQQQVAPPPANQSPIITRGGSPRIF